MYFYLVYTPDVIDIRSDREGGIYKLKDALAQGGIVLNDAGAGSHVGMIESIDPEQIG